MSNGMAVKYLPMKQKYNKINLSLGLGARQKSHNYNQITNTEILP